jgi:hypothetical protein
VEYPDWYIDWRHDAFHQLEEKNARLKAKYRLGDWPRYDYELAAGTMIFSDRGVPKITAAIQIVGSTSFKARNWLWAWANSHLPTERVTDAELVRAFGEEHGICELTHDYVGGEADLNSLGWELTAVIVRVTGALGAYRPPRDDGGDVYLTYKSVAFVS